MYKDLFNYLIQKRKLQLNPLSLNNYFFYIYFLKTFSKGMNSRWSCTNPAGQAISGPKFRLGWRGKQSQPCNAYRLESSPYFLYYSILVSYFGKFDNDLIVLQESIFFLLPRHPKIAQVSFLCRWRMQCVRKML